MQKKMEEAGRFRSKSPVSTSEEEDDYGKQSSLQDGTKVGRSKYVRRQSHSQINKNAIKKQIDECLKAAQNRPMIRERVMHTMNYLEDQLNNIRAREGYEA